MSKQTFVFEVNKHEIEAILTVNPEKYTAKIEFKDDYFPIIQDMLMPINVLTHLSFVPVVISHLRNQISQYENIKTIEFKRRPNESQAKNNSRT